jgi:hypothetical protein
VTQNIIYSNVERLNEMGKSFNKKGFFDDMEYEDNYSYKGSKKKSYKENDKKLQIQQARKNAQAERDRAIKEFTSSQEN